jgi:hypothetical protein
MKPESPNALGKFFKIFPLMHLMTILASYHAPHQPKVIDALRIFFPQFMHLMTHLASCDAPHEARVIECIGENFSIFSIDALNDSSGSI